MPVSCEFKNRFLEFVNEQELKHTLIAEKMGVPYDIFSKIKNYGIIPTPRILIRIADYFDTSIDYLLARTGNDNFAKANCTDTFHNRLDILRNEKGLSYYALGKKLHISSNYFFDWKTKNYIPSLDYLLLLSDYFDVSLDYILGRTDY